MRLLLQHEAPSEAQTRDYVSLYLASEWGSFVVRLMERSYTSDRTPLGSHREGTSRRLRGCCWNMELEENEKVAESEWSYLRACYIIPRSGSALMYPIKRRGKYTATSSTQTSLLCHLSSRNCLTSVVSPLFPHLPDAVATDP